MPSVMVMPMPGRSPSWTLCNRFLPGECCAMSMMTKSADRPTSIRPQSSARIRAVKRQARGTPAATQRSIELRTQTAWQLVWKFAEHLQGRLHGDDVAIKTQSANDGSRSTRQYRVPVPFVAGVYVGYVKFDNG